MPYSIHTHARQIDNEAPVVLSVNDEKGTVTLTTDDVGEGSTNLYYTDARVSASSLAALVATYSGELTALTDDEVKQLHNIGTTTISAQQWAWLGAADQAWDTTADFNVNTLTSATDITVTAGDMDILAGDGYFRDGIRLGTSTKRSGVGMHGDGTNMYMYGTEVYIRHNGTESNEGAWRFLDHQLWVRDQANSAYIQIIDCQASDTIQFYGNLNITSTGNVGLQKTNPLYLFDVRNSSTTPNTPMIAITDPTNPRYACGIGLNGATKMSFYMGETVDNSTPLGTTHEHMILNSSGQLGINVEPAAQLHVDGSFYLDTDGIWTRGTSTPLYSTHNDGTYGYDTTISYSGQKLFIATQLDSTQGNMVLTSSSAGTKLATLELRADATTITDTLTVGDNLEVNGDAIIIDTLNPRLDFQCDDGITYRIRANETGNYLELGHTSQVGLRLGNTGQAIFPSGNVVVGDAAAISKFTVSSSGNNGIAISETGGAAQAYIGLYDNTTLKWQIGKQGNNSFFMYDAANAFNFLAVDTSGNTTITSQDVITISAPRVIRSGTYSESGAIYGTLHQVNMEETGAASGTCEYYIGGTHTVNGTGVNGTSWLQIHPTAVATSAISNVEGLNIYPSTISGAAATSTAYGAVIHGCSSVGAGGLTDAISLSIVGPTAGTNRHGLIIGNVSGGSTNIAIQTGTGTHSFGDDVLVNGNLQLGTGNGDYQRMRIGGGNSSGFLYGAFDELGDGIHIGYNYYNDNTSGTVIQSGGGTSRLSLQYGGISMYTGANGVAPNTLGLYQNNAGNVGIGTFTLTEKLTVDGNIAVSGTVDGVDVAALKTDVDGFPDALKNLTTDEIGQLENIGTTTVSSAAWTNLSLMNQAVGDTSSVQFSKVTIDKTTGSIKDTPSTDGFLLIVKGETFQDNTTAASGTSADMAFNSIGQSTHTALNSSVTTTNAATLYIEGAPVAGTNMTITNPLALWIDAGVSRFDDGITFEEGGDVFDYDYEGTNSVTWTGSINVDKSSNFTYTKKGKTITLDFEEWFQSGSATAGIIESSGTPVPAAIRPAETRFTPVYNTDAVDSAVNWGVIVIATDGSIELWKTPGSHDFASGTGARTFGPVSVTYNI